MVLKNENILFSSFLIQVYMTRCYYLNIFKRSSLLLSMFVLVSIKVHVSDINNPQMECWFDFDFVHSGFFTVQQFYITPEQELLNGLSIPLFF